MELSRSTRSLGGRDGHSIRQETIFRFIRNRPNEYARRIRAMRIPELMREAERFAKIEPEMSDADAAEMEARRSEAAHPRLTLNCGVLHAPLGEGVSLPRHRSPQRGPRSPARVPPVPAGLLFILGRRLSGPDHTYFPRSGQGRRGQGRRRACPSSGALYRPPSRLIRAQAAAQKGRPPKRAPLQSCFSRECLWFRRKSPIAQLRRHPLLGFGLSVRGSQELWAG